MAKKKAHIGPLVLDKACDITPFTDTKSTRYALSGVCWDADRNALSATDSRMLAVIQPPDAGEEFGPAADAPQVRTVIPASVLKAAIRETRKANRKRRVPVRQTVALVSASGGEVEVATESPSGKVSRKAKAIEGRYPNLHAVLPKRESVQLEVTVDQKLLKVIADYFTTHGTEGDGILLRFTGKDTPVEICGNVGDGSRRAYVVLMPLKSVDGADECVPMAREAF